MQFLVFSDSHRDTSVMDYAIDRHKNIRHIIHCGDMSEDVEYLIYVYGKTHNTVSVCGNNNFRSANEPYSRIVYAEKHKIYVTHGHLEHVK